MRKKGIILMLAIVCCLSVVASITIQADATVFQYSLFDFDNAYAETNVAVPSSTGITLGERGLGVTAQQSGASISLKNTVAGVFDISFLPYSVASYGGSTIEGGAFENNYQDVSQISLVFTDKNDTTKSFAVRLTGGADGNNVTVNASVDTGSYRAGIYYYHDNDACGNTSGYNSQNVYTYLYGTSFSNMAVSAGSYSSANVRPIRIVFDPIEMAVYGYNYGYSAYSTEKRLIWDMSKTEIDGRKVDTVLESFDKYNVSLVFDSVKSGSTASAIIYSINGQSLASSVAVNATGPVCSLKVSEQNVNGAYKLPVPTCFDVIDGIIDFDGAVKVLDSQGSTLTITVDGTKAKSLGDGWYEWENGASVNITDSGYYTLSYKAKDLDDVYGEEYTVSLPVNVSNGGLQITEDFDAYVKVGDTINVPSAKWTGSNVTAQFTVIAPDGSQVKSPYMATMEGRYTVNYFATVGEQRLESNLYIYSFQQNADLLKTSNGVSVVAGTSALHSKLEGLIVTTTVANGTVTYSKEIDIQSKTKNDTLISFMALPIRTGSSALGQISVKLVDSSNESNYVTLLVSSATEDDMSVVRAGSAEQTPAGLSNSGAVESYVGGGTKVFHSFYGIANYTDITNQFIDLRMDYATKCVYVGDKLVCDLDDSEYFTQAWEGFEGKAILSVTLRELASDRASILINELDGNKIYGNYYGDCVSPTISAEFDVNNVPNAQVGKKYSVLPVTLKDNSNETPALSVAVTDKNGANVELIDGKYFIPTEEGEYRMTFTATDRAGNSITISYGINAYATIENPTINLTSSVPSAGYVGETITLPNYVVANGSGLNKVKIKVVGKNTNTNCDVNDLTFKTVVADTYVVTYLVTDYLGNPNSVNDEIAITVSAKPIWNELPTLGDILIADRQVTLPSASAYDYVANKSANVTVQVSIDDEIINVGDDLVYTLTTTKAQSQATITYIATAQSGEMARKEFVVSVVNLYNEDEELVLSRYFKTEGFDEVKQEEDYISFAFSHDNNLIEFVKTVYAHGFELTFDVPVGANNFNSLTVEFIDSVDTTKKVVFTIQKGGFADSTSNVSINGLQTISIQGNFFESVKRLRIAYDNNDYSLQDATGLVVGYVKNYADGSRFKGFSDEINVKIHADEVSGIGQINMYKFGNQLLMENDGDYTKPVIITEKEVERSATKGSQLLIPKAKAFDILGFETTITVSVTCNGETLLSKASADEEHVLTLDKYGEYSVEYSAFDDNYNKATSTFVVNVRDNVAPTIAVDQTEIVVYAGTEVKLPTVNVTDDVEIAKQYVFIIDVANDMINVTGKDSFTPTEKGIYIIRYVAIDTSNNYAICDVVVKVAEAK